MIDRFGLFGLPAEDLSAAALLRQGAAGAQAVDRPAVQHAARPTALPAVRRDGRPTDMNVADRAQRVSNRLAAFAGAFAFIGGTAIACPFGDTEPVEAEVSAEQRPA